ncbi:MAG: hypothetical protein R3C68_00490 [Myxococcota bacterium]
MSDPFASFDPKDKLEDAYNYVSAMQGTRCRSSFARLRVQCLIEIAHDNCRDRRGNAKDDCLLYSDVIVVNHLSEDEFISPEQRYRIMRDHRDYRPRLRTALDREYAALTTRLILSIDDICKADDYPCLSKHIDTFCLDYADKHNISWQYCVAAMLWSVGTAETAPAPSMCSRENTGG